ncbi:MAG: dUTP diphosphatase [Candidatus Margulisiibacteriota bacterium]|nr:MAG: deoxyuridine 5'-triphosphate nucleotidohydrolase [Candidatus Margulisbacteria bacterium GWD2_39_127]OGI01587.1 MAG: deoxyuridine 5'-triphosphate nucleotidohydrolase [Candidatus Margulisbacteria bacterium GWF2_38_17]OGI10029.1 MAG: deoxyuridine 5'-triphosphate nucleotidohydrolase [Candidatus Margulisbacteria bacterium GWE2_39_32]PZM78284.1 MAG: dUTP diphosphatase [Candidatus Margulisiibacteriota bacterium]HAR61828.1 dUTP diphosphatase [Candidatus Margulisiibacteriota bacterium]
MKIIGVKIQQLHSIDLPLPGYMSEQAAGMDLYAAIDQPEMLLPGEIKAISTGISIEIPEGYEAQIRPRSGLALKKGISIPNAPGTIDSDYRGEIKVILINLGSEPFEIGRGDRIAQMIVAPVVQVRWIKSEDLTVTSRASGGFGHTGV